MKAYQCDRCFRYYTDNKDVIIPGAPSNSILTGIKLCKNHDPEKSPVKDYDLCDDCAKTLVDWLQNRGNL